MKIAVKSRKTALLGVITLVGLVLLLGYIAKENNLITRVVVAQAKLAPVELADDVKNELKVYMYRFVGRDSTGLGLAVARPASAEYVPIAIKAHNSAYQEQESQIPQLVNELFSPLTDNTERNCLGDARAPSDTVHTSKWFVGNFKNLRDFDVTLYVEYQKKVFAIPNHYIANFCFDAIE